MERRPLWDWLAVSKAIQWRRVRSQRRGGGSTAEELAETRDGKSEIKDTWAHLSGFSQQDRRSRTTEQNNLTAISLRFWKHELSLGNLEQKLRIGVLGSWRTPGSACSGGETKGCSRESVPRPPALKLAYWHQDKGWMKTMNNSTTSRGTQAQPRLQQVPTPQCHSGTKHCQHSHQNILLK